MELRSELLNGEIGVTVTEFEAELVRAELLGITGQLGKFS